MAWQDKGLSVSPLGKAKYLNNQSFFVRVAGVLASIALTMIATQAVIATLAVKPQCAPFAGSYGANAG